MKEIQLTHGQVALVDDAFFDAIATNKWQAMKHRSTWYAVRDVSRKSPLWPAKIMMHRFVLELSGQPLGSETDHRDGNGLNNTLDNLRPATASQNQGNSRLRKDNRSGFKGVGFNRASSKWIARIKLNGRLKVIGYFDSPESAAAAYDAAAIANRGEYARTNGVSE